VHESRCFVIQGEYVPERRKEEQDGWMGSRLAHCWHQLQRLGVSHQWAEKILERSQQAVNKMTGLANQLSAPGGQNAAMNRLHLLDMSRNILNTVAIDANDDYTLHSASLSGIPDLLDRFAQALSAVSGMPKTLLFGEQAKGLNNGGEGDMLLWQNQIKQWQRTKLLKPIDRTVQLLAIAQGIPDQNYMIEFCDILEPNEKEEAEIEKLEAEAKKIKADTAAVYVTAGALDPSELRNTLAESGDYVMDTTITIGGEDDGLPA
jgi:phage-related protein (TIGR01555 family)